MAYIYHPPICWFVWLNRVAYIKTVCRDGVATKPYLKVRHSGNSYIRNEAPIGCEPRNILTHRGKRYLIKERDGSCMLVSSIS